MRKIFFVMLACVAFCTAQGQRFEWAKGYDSSYDDAYIKGSVTDSLGNLYILGQIHWDSDWDQDEEPLCWQVTTENTMVLVAKISPEGEMVWKKTFAHSGNGTYAYDIKPMGDTGFAVMFQDQVCEPYYEHRYWVDSLYRDIPHPLLEGRPTSGMGYELFDGNLTVYMAFDFDGNITEQHLLQMSFVDSDGHNVFIRPYVDTLVYMVNPWNATFDFDVEGNIYVCYMLPILPRANSFYFNDTLASYRYWVDHRFVGEVPMGNSPKLWFPHMIKFSPHFDTLLAGRYVVQDCDRRADSINNIGSTIKYLKVNKSSNKLYLRNYIDYLFSVTENIVIDSNANMILTIPRGYTRVGYVTVHDTNLLPVNLINIRDSVLVPEDYYTATYLDDIEFDSDSGLVFINGYFGSRNTRFFYNNEPLGIENKVCVLVFDENDLGLHSILKFPCEKTSSGSYGFGNVKAKNNRVFTQSGYKYALYLPSGNHYIPSSQMGLALAIWDYQGNLIDGLDYHNTSKYSDTGPISLADSTLYLITRLAGPATFGEHTVYASPYRATIAKYVDTSFMSVYRWPSPEAVDVAEQGKVSCYPNPARDVLSLDLGNEMLLQATAVSILGQATTVAVGIDWVDISPLPAGTYLLEVETARHNKYKTVFVKQ